LSSKYQGEAIVQQIIMYHHGWRATGRLLVCKIPAQETAKPQNNVSQKNDIHCQQNGKKNQDFKMHSVLGANGVRHRLPLFLICRDISFNHFVIQSALCCCCSQHI
jgi:hypothetical protein